MCFLRGVDHELSNGGGWSRPTCGSADKRSVSIVQTSFRLDQCRSLSIVIDRSNVQRERFCFSIRKWNRRKIKDSRFEITEN